MKNNVTVIPLIITEEQKKKWAEILVDYYSKIGKLTLPQIKDKITKVLDACERGWPHAPNTLETRISRKTGYKSGLLSNLQNQQAFKVKMQQKKEERAVVLEQSKTFSTLKEALSIEEQTWWGQRLTEYKQEFEFNISSDMVLLNQLLVEELLQRRMFFEHLKSNRAMDTDTSKILTESNKRIQDLQTKLGITRDQRTGVINQIDGNVANLSVQLEVKLKEYEEEEKSQLEEELRLWSIRSQEPPINQLPSEQQIETILSGNNDAVFSREDINRKDMEVEQPELNRKEKKEEVDLPDTGIVL